MSLSTYEGLKNSIADWLKRDELTAAIPDFITLAESQIYRRLKVRDMEADLSVVISSGVAVAPSDYVGLRNAYLDTNPISVLELRDPSWILSEYPHRTADGRPAFIARDKTTFIFGPFPDSDYAVLGTYYKRLSPLSEALNTLFSESPGLFLFGALLQAEKYVRNDPAVEAMIPIWRDSFETEIQDIHAAYEREKSMPGRMAVRGRGSMP